MEKFGYVIATKMLVDGKRSVRFMYREKPSNVQDSGWRFFCGDEDEWYINCSENMAVYDINTILAIDNSVFPHLTAPVGAVFEREDESSCFHSVAI